MSHTHLPKRKVKQADGKWLTLGGIEFGDTGRGEYCSLPYFHATEVGWCRHGEGTACSAGRHECDGSGIVKPYVKETT